MRYELVERIGAGGMAEIFRGKALAAGGFEKPVAIKRILPHLSQDERFVKLLIAEAKILSLLRHRNIVQIFDVGLGPDGDYFLVMEYVDGADLGAMYEKLEARRKRLPVDMALHICAEMCEALDYAHRAKGPNDTPLRIVHRDVSPANIMLSRSGEVKLTDFGIAKHAEETTGHGGVRGKFAYISPEQAINAKVDGRSDVCSLGIVLYELVLGHRLYSNLPDFDALKAVREGRVTRPREIDHEIDYELEDILLKALAHDPADRFPDAGDFGSTLRTFRYSLSSSGGDPAKEIARIVGQFNPKTEDAIEHEATVVRIETAAGFGAAELYDVAGMEELVEDDSDPFAAARQVLDAFEDEETHTLERESSERETTVRQELIPTKLELPESRAARTIEREPQDADAEWAAAAGGDMTVREIVPTEPFGTQRDRIETRESSIAPLPPVPVREPAPERAATPTARDVFSSHQLLGDATPSAEPIVPSQVATTPPPDPMLYRQAKRRQLALLSLAAMAMAVLSFLIAQAILGGDDEPAAAMPPTVDAAPPPADAMVEEIVMPPDPIKSTKKKKRRPKKKPRKGGAKKR